MLTDSERQKLVERFLTGTMDADEQQTFSDILGNDGVLRELLDCESGVEALLHDTGSTTHADERFSGALEKGLHHFPQFHHTKKRNPAIWVQFYALAASLLLAVTGWLLITGREQQEVLPASATPVAEDSLVRRTGKSISRFSEHALYVSEEGTRIRVMQDSDSMLNVVLSQGNVCFDIAERENKPITVATPHVAVLLSTAAVTKIVVTELETEVTVLDGAAEVIHRYQRESPNRLVAGGTVFADFDAVQVAHTIAPEVCESRTTMFRAYVSWIRKKAHG